MLNNAISGLEIWEENFQQKEERAEKLRTDAKKKHEKLLINGTEEEEDE